MIHCDIFIAGGGLGGIAAAISALKTGNSVIISDQNKWLGGQISSQGVSALDEHKLMNSFGGTKTYYEFRDRIKEYYRKNFTIKDQFKNNGFFNPGCSNQNRRFSFEPDVGAKVLKEMLQDYDKDMNLRIFLNTKVSHLKVLDDIIDRVYLQDLISDKIREIQPSYVIDATELGELLPLAGIPYRTGIESFSETHEPSAPQKSNPLATQSFCFPFAVEYCSDENHIIEKPVLYENIKKEKKFSFNGKRFFEPGSKDCSFWTYRLILDSDNFNDKSMRNDVSLFNCSSMDYNDDTIIDKCDKHIAKHLFRAKQLSLCFLYWIQTEAERQDGKKGYPELKLRYDLMGTTDGLSQYPYIRESRRMSSIDIIKEQDIVSNFNSGSRARLFNDSIGIGWYMYIDIHWCCNSKLRNGSGLAVLPFQIPLSSIIGDKIKNFISAAKNIGTTHITNGVYRLHPVEWNIGDSAGLLAAYSLKNNCRPYDIYYDKELLRDFQLYLLIKGIALYWFIDIPLDDKYFIPVQYLAMEGIIRGNSEHLYFYPDKNLLNATANNWLKQLKLRFRVNKDQFIHIKNSSHKYTRGEFALELFNILKEKKD